LASAAGVAEAIAADDAVIAEEALVPGMLAGDALISALEESTLGTSGFEGSGLTEATRASAGAAFG